MFGMTFGSLKPNLNKTSWYNHRCNLPPFRWVRGGLMSLEWVNKDAEEGESAGKPEQETERLDSRESPTDGFELRPAVLHRRLFATVGQSLVLKLCTLYTINIHFKKPVELQTKHAPLVQIANIQTIYGLACGFQTP